MQHFTTDEFNAIIKGWITQLINFAPTIIGAIIMFFIGKFVIRMILKVIKGIFERREVDPGLQSFLIQLSRWGLYITLFLIIIQIIGIPATSFLAALGTASVAIGLALQGSLSNFAAGIMLLLFKPFRVGDVIEAKGEKGTVKIIGLFATTINKFNNEEAIIPNGPLFSDKIINFSREEKRRIKVMVGIGYTSDIKKAKEILLDIALNDPRTLEDTKPVVFVEELADSSVNLSVQFWVKNENYWNCYFETIENVKLQFDKHDIEIPFPQQDVYIRSN